MRISLDNILLVNTGKSYELSPGLSLFKQEILNKKKYSHNGKIYGVHSLTQEGERLIIETHGADYESSLITEYSSQLVLSNGKLVSEMISEGEGVKSLGFLMLIKSSDGKYLWVKRSNTAVDNNKWSYPVSGTFEQESLSFKQLVSRELSEEISPKIIQYSNINLIKIFNNSNKMNRPEFILLNEVCLSSIEITKIMLENNNLREYSNFFWSRSPKELLNIPDHCSSAQYLEA